MVRELGILEVEFSEWSNNFGARWEERKELKGCINMMHIFQRQRRNEKKTIKQTLEVARRDLPVCMVLMSTLQVAAQVAASLNTSFNAGGGSSGGDDSSGIPVVSTPAEDVRRQHRRLGWGALSLEEQKWSIMDEGLFPEKYDWLTEQHEEENMARALKGLGKKERKLSAAVRVYDLDPSEIRHIQTQPFSMLTRREMLVRKLFAKFHDNMDQMLRDHAAIGSGFDKHIAERTRAKNYRNWSKDDKAWVTIDKKLHPELWAYYVHSDANRDAFMDRAGGASTAKHESEEDGDSPKKGVEVSKQRAKAKKDEEKKAKKAKKELEAKEAAEKEKGGWGFMKKKGTDTAGDAKKGKKDKKKKDKDKGTHSGAESGAESSGGKEGSTSRGARRTDDDDDDQPVVRRKEIPWECPFEKHEIMEIWRTDRRYLRNDDERVCSKYLARYNGPYSLFLEMTRDKAERDKHTSKAGHHIKFNNPGNVQTSDVDLRCRQLLLEIDRARTTKNEWLDTKLLHASNQRFPTAVVRLQLEDVLDNILMNEITERERQDRLRLSEKNQDDADAEEMTRDVVIGDADGPERLDSAVDDHLERKHTTVHTAESGWTTAGDTAGGTAGTRGTAASRAANRRKGGTADGGGGGAKGALMKGQASPGKSKRGSSSKGGGLDGVEPPDELASLEDPGHGHHANRIDTGPLPGEVVAVLERPRHWSHLDTDVTHLL